MDIAKAKQHVKDTIEAYLSKDEQGFYRVELAKQRPLFLLGAPGIGKTAIMTQVAQELGIGLVSYSMTHHTRQSALGLPFIVHRDYKGYEYDASEYTMSEIVASLYDYMEATGLETGILFLDEINCVSETLYPSMLQFLQFKTFGRHRIPDDWVVVCAGNPPEYNRSVHEFDIVTLDRLRKLEVEPDYPVWRKYALAKNVHPSVLSFLEVRKECFYSVESTPSGKKFVTARGWDDLAETIALFEATGKEVDRSLIEQFLQDEDIAEAFSVYYQLFQKYRSDYRVDRILDGDTDATVLERAKEAPFDERLALMGLLLDGVASRLGETLEAQGSLEDVRDTLRSMRGPLCDGGTVVEVLGAEIARREERLKRQMDSNTATKQVMREGRRTINTLKALRHECDMAQTPAGSAAFDSIHYGYRGFVSELEQNIKASQAALTNAFDFVEQAFGNDREMLVFVTELTARTAPAQFINRYGNDRYYASNQRLMVDERRKDLLDRIASIDPTAPAAPSVSDYAVDPGVTVVSASASKDRALCEYYSSAQFEYGFASLCNMNLPSDLRGKHVLNIGCRRGKGVFKMSDMVGANGHVTGIDWSVDHIKEAKERMDRAWQKSGLPANNMEFHVAYPEDLFAAGLGDSTVDVAFINSVINLTYDPARAYAEICRVLKPGGLLIVDTTTASTNRNKEVVEMARSIGNSIQAAPSRAELEEILRIAGFDKPVYKMGYEIDPATGYKFTHKVATVASDENVTFTAQVVEVRKPRH